MADRDHGMPDAVVRTTDELYLTEGRLTLGSNVTVTPEIFEQYRTGYRCLACHHFPQPHAFPKECCEPYCRFPIARDQIRQLEFEDRGEIDLWPTRGEEDDERRERLAEQDVWLPPEFRSNH